MSHWPSGPVLFVLVVAFSALGTSGVRAAATKDVGVWAGAMNMAAGALREQNQRSPPAK